MFKLSSQYIWQWIVFMAILFTMFNGIDWFFKSAEYEEIHSEELDISHQINNNIKLLLEKMDIIIEKLDKKK